MLLVSMQGFLCIEGVDFSEVPVIQCQDFQIYFELEFFLQFNVLEELDGDDVVQTCAIQHHFK